MKIPLIAIIGAFMTLLTGCVSSNQVAADLNNRYAGKNVDQFFIEHGLPAAKHQLNSGDILYVWDSGVKTIDMPPTTAIHGNDVVGYTATTTGGSSFHLQCVVQIETAPDGMVRSMRILRDSGGAWTTSRCHETL